jgi:hypothetical protein
MLSMIAIHTKYLPATNRQGSRIKAFTVYSSGRRGFETVIPYPHEFSFEMVHFQAVLALVKKHDLDWNLSNMRYGDSADGRGYTFCFADSIVDHDVSPMLKAA